MNDRIRQLAEQAGAEVRAEWDKGNKIPYPEAHLAFQRDNDQKFAELIVRECASIVDNHGRWILYDKLAVKIKQHFGVAE